MITNKTILALSLMGLIMVGCGSTSTANIIEDKVETNVGSGDTSILTDEDKYALAYMWHEEKLAYELYLELNKVQPANQFVNIANNSEIKHIEAVEELIAKYNIDITNLGDTEMGYSEAELRAMPVGEFAIEKIQTLYDTLYTKGIQSKQDALEVGCMVEVVDIIDLDEFIHAVEGKDDLVSTFEFLKAGSYNHYWSFDKGLKSIGVSEGCCAVDSFSGIDFCHPEYPSK